jgi:hypothetical protein
MLTIAQHYTGIGSRSTPDDVLYLMYQLACRLDTEMNLVLRSGGADGADSAFARGASRAQIYQPWPGFVRSTDARHQLFDEPTDAAYDLARRIHPAWANLTQGGRKLHARNAHQVLGYDLKTPSKFLVCWTPDAKDVGGTATAIRLARANNIPIRNLADPLRRNAAQRWLAS